jgi:hypothetical protein
MLEEIRRKPTRRRRPEKRWMRRPRGRRPWWWLNSLMRAKAPRMFRL